MTLGNDWPRPEADHWRDQAACRDHPTEVFFPGKNNPQAMRQAKAICAECPVADRCLDLALSNPWYGDHGVWGGLSENERSKIRRTRPSVPVRRHDPAPHGSGGAYRRHYREGTPVCEACKTWKRINTELRAERRREAS